MSRAFRIGRRFYSEKVPSSFDLSGFLGRIEALQKNKRVGRPQRQRKKGSETPRIPKQAASGSSATRPPRSSKGVQGSEARQTQPNRRSQGDRESRRERIKQPTVAASKEPESAFSPGFSSLTSTPLPKAGVRRRPAARRPRGSSNRLRVARGPEGSDGKRSPGVGAFLGDSGFMYSKDALSLVESYENSGGGFVSAGNVTPEALIRFMPPSAVTYDVRVLSALHALKVDTAKTRVTGVYPAPVEDSLVGHQLAQNPTLGQPQQQFLAKVAAGLVPPAEVR